MFYRNEIGFACCMIKSLSCIHNISLSQLSCILYNAHQRHYIYPYSDVIILATPFVTCYKILTTYYFNVGREVQ